MKYPHYHPLSKDPIMKTLISAHELPETKSDPDLYIALIESIISQQLSIKASDTIFKRFLDIFGDKNPTPGQIITIPDETLRGVGISYAKIKYIKGIDEAVSNKKIDLDALHTMTDEEVITELTKLKGIGRWTAEMLLIFSLKRDDVFSLGDLGLRKAVSKLYNVDREDLKTIGTISMKWSPFRSYASRLLWKSLDNTPK